MVTVAKRRDPDICDVCDEAAEKVYAFGAVILGLDLRSGDQVVTEHKICIGCLGVLIQLVLDDQLPQ